MFISEDGTVTGSVDVSRLGEVEPQSDEAKAQHEALTREVQQGQEQAAKDAERASQGERALGINSTGRTDDTSDDEDQAKAREPQQPDTDAEVKRLTAEAEQAGVTVDKRWGADRLRSEIASAQAAKRKG